MGAWCGLEMEIISPFLHLDILKKIQAYKLKNDLKAGDLVYWKDAKKGKFSIRSTLFALCTKKDRVLGCSEKSSCLAMYTSFSLDSLSQLCSW